MAKRKQTKGTNKTVLPLLFSDPRLALVPRPSSSAFSRPESKAHLDNFVVSACLMRRIVSEIQYINLQAEKKEDSDHLMILLSTDRSVTTRRAPPEYKTQYNTLALRNELSADYKLALGDLALRWISWAKDLRQYLQVTKQTTPRHVITTAYAGLIMRIQSASFKPWVSGESR